MIRFLNKFGSWRLEIPMRHTVKFLYDMVIFWELQIYRLYDRLHIDNRPGDTQILDDLTIVIKTFERPRILSRLINSIKRFYPSIQIIVVDDSQILSVLDDVRLIRMPFNTGVSAGRNEGLKHVKTKYTLFLDDDFIFTGKTNLVPNVKILESAPRIDILGGKMINLPYFRTIDYRSAGLYSTQSEPVMPIGSTIAGLPVYDIVAQFFICRTDRVRELGWDPFLKTMEHSDFFTRARGRLVTVYNKEFQCLHAPTPFDGKYMKFRTNVASATSHILNKDYSMAGLSSPPDSPIHTD